MGCWDWKCRPKLGSLDIWCLTKSHTATNLQVESTGTFSHNTSSPQYFCPKILFNIFSYVTFTDFPTFLGTIILHDVILVVGGGCANLVPRRQCCGILPCMVIQIKRCVGEIKVCSNHEIYMAVFLVCIRVSVRDGYNLNLCPCFDLRTGAFQDVLPQVTPICHQYWWFLV